MKTIDKQGLHQNKYLAENDPVDNYKSFADYQNASPGISSKLSSRQSDHQRKNIAFLKGKQIGKPIHEANTSLSVLDSSRV